VTGSLFPTDEEIERLIVGPESLTWQYGSDVRLFLSPLYPLLLQVAHPTVGAGVMDYSDFEQRPWNRLLGTIDYLLVLQYGGFEAAAMGRRLREVHKRFRGVKPDGEGYSALEPSAYAWVHATLLDAYVTGHARFGRPMTPEQIECFYREYIGLGRLIGVRERDLPPDWNGFRTQFDHVIEHELEHTASVDRVLRAIRHAPLPEVPLVPDFVWRAIRIPARRVLNLCGVGLLSPRLRERLGIRWTRRDERELRLIAAGSRSLTPVLPTALKVTGPAQLRLRRRAIARGPLGAAADQGQGPSRVTKAA
jgi:uncharacterized protein (DUF2236 family)